MNYMVTVNTVIYLINYNCYILDVMIKCLKL